MWYKCEVYLSYIVGSELSHFVLHFRYELLTPNVIPKGFMDGKKACEKMVSFLPFKAQWLLHPPLVSIF
jgi:hypothetical protein